MQTRLILLLAVIVAISQQRQNDRVCCPFPTSQQEFCRQTKTKWIWTHDGLQKTLLNEYILAHSTVLAMVMSIAIELIDHAYQLFT